MYIAIVIHFAIVIKVDKNFCHVYLIHVYEFCSETSFVFIDEHGIVVVWNLQRRCVYLPNP